MSIKNKNTKFQMSRKKIFDGIREWTILINERVV